MNKREIKIHLQYSWWIYLLLAIAVVAIWLSIFAKLAEPKANEMLNITIVGSVDENKMQSGISTALNGKTEKPLKEIRVESLASNNAMLGELIAMRCVGDTDFIIFEEDCIYDNIGDLFSPIDKSIMSSYIGECEYLVQKDITLGILLNGENAKNNFTEFYKGEKKCWLFITPASCNVAAMNGKGNEQDNAALLAIKYLLESQDV